MWIWEKKDWIHTPAWSSSLYEEAAKLEEREKELAASLDVGLLHRLTHRALENEVIGNSAIEGYNLDRRLVRSSIARSMGMIQNAQDFVPARQNSAREENAVKATLMLLEAPAVLDHDLLLKTHGQIDTGEGWGVYRDHPEYVVDEEGNAVYTAPDAESVPGLMNTFLHWWNTVRPALPAAVGSALGHFFFVTIHPFADGNGRMARMLSDKALAASGSFRPFSLSSVIQNNKEDYYAALSSAQACVSTLESWVAFMLSLQGVALRSAQAKADRLAFLKKAIEESPLDFSPEEKHIMYEMTVGERTSWNEFEATRYMDDDELAENAWNRLVDLGIIQNGRLQVQKIYQPCSHEKENNSFRPE